MAGIRVHVVMPAELVARVDAVRGEGVSRGEFVRRAVEQALAETRSPEVARNAREPSGFAAPAEQPGKALDEARTLAGLRRPAEQSYRSSSFAKRDVRPVPKKGG